VVIPLSDAGPEEILYSVNGKTNAKSVVSLKKTPNVDARPVSYEKYAKAFYFVQQHIRHANSFLLNLPFPATIRTNQDAVPPACGDLTGGSSHHCPG